MQQHQLQSTYKVLYQKSFIPVDFIPKDMTKRNKTKKQTKKRKHIFAQANKYCVANVKCFYKMVGCVFVISMHAATNATIKRE